MKYVKIISVFIIVYLVYLGFSKFMDSSLEVAEKVNKISEIDKVEVSNNKEVVGLMMFLGSPPKLNEHLMMPSGEDCLIKKEIAELTSSALYKCMLVEAEVKENKIVSIVKEIKIIE
tara:strand:- start:1406 stop:1756 length:351 start_codon:yes stop_codon:yes gene_type:complete